MVKIPILFQNAHHMSYQGERRGVVWDFFYSDLTISKSPLKELYLIMENFNIATLSKVQKIL